MVAVLIIEDDEAKLRRIRKVVHDVGENRVVIAEAGNCIDAIRWCQFNHCDILILDLQIPLRDDELPDKSGGEAFLQKLVRADSKCCTPSQVVGLTAFEQLREEFRSHFEREGWVIARYEHSSRDWEETVSSAVRRELLVASGSPRRGLLLALHGIRTTAEWHRTIADIAQSENWICPIQKMWYGQFSIFQFLSPFARSAKVYWFRSRYTEILTAYEGRFVAECLPSVVAHSFGTLILGNALLKYKDIRVDSVILCGSILPRDFPWDVLIENGQVQRVLHDVGKNDHWSAICSLIIPGTGSSGRNGFSRSSPYMIQEYHNLSHNDFFDGRQMQKHWFSFLNADHLKTGAGNTARVDWSYGDHPYVTPFTSLAVFILLVSVLVSCAYVCGKVFTIIVEVSVVGMFEAIRTLFQ